MKCGNRIMVEHHHHKSSVLFFVQSTRYLIEFACRHFLLIYMCVYFFLIYLAIDLLSIIYDFSGRTSLITILRCLRVSLVICHDFTGALFTDREGEISVFYNNYFSIQYHDLQTANSRRQNQF